MNNGKGGEELVIFSELATQAITFHTLSYLYLTQSKKNDDVRYETIISHLIQYLVDETHIPDSYRKKVLDIDTKRKIVSLAISELETLYVPVQTLEKIIQFDMDKVKMYVKLLKYFDNYAFRFQIVSVEVENTKNNKRKEHHILSVDVHESKSSLKSETDIKNFITDLSSKLGISITVNLNTHQSM